MPKTLKPTKTQDRPAKKGARRDGKIVGGSQFRTKSAAMVSSKNGHVSVRGVNSKTIGGLVAEALRGTRTAVPKVAPQSQLAELTEERARPKVADVSSERALELLAKGAREAERRHIEAGRTVGAFDEDGRRTGDVERARTTEKTEELEAEA